MADQPSGQLSGQMSLAQPPVPPDRLAAAAGALTRYRVMAFVTGVVLLLGCLALVLKALDVPHMEPWTGFVWVAHGYLYLVYVIMVAMLGVKLRWPLLRFALVMLAGTIPTASFFAEHYVTRAVARAAGSTQIAPAK